MAPDRERWDERCEELRVFVTTHDRRPSKYAKDQAERSLWVWMHNQRVTFRDGTRLDTDQRALLAGIAGFFPTRSRRPWDESFALVKAHFERCGSRPRVLTQDLEEARIARWLDTQIQRMLDYPGARQYGPLTQEQEGLIRSLPGLADAAPAKPRLSWDENFTKAAEFIDQHGRTPRASSTDAEERRLSGWLSKQRSRYQQIAPSAKPLSPERQSLLQQLPGFVTERARRKLGEG